MKIERIGLEGVNLNGSREIVPDAFVMMPVCESDTDPANADAELWVGGELMHRLPMSRMTADFNGRLVYAPASTSARERPASQFEHTVNLAVNNLVICGDGPIDQDWRAE